MNDQMIPSGQAAPTRLPVVIVGAGPVGCVAALELARLGQATIVLDSTDAAPVHPKMDYVSGRTMEYFRQLGLAPKVRAAGIDPGVPAYFRWHDTFGAPPIHSWRHPSPDEYRNGTIRGEVPGALESYVRIRGSLLESLLRDELAAHPLVTWRAGTQVELFDQDDDSVSVTTRSAIGTQTLHGSHLLACDGAGSRIRHQLGIGVDTLGEHVLSRSIYFASSDPALRRHGPSFIQIIGTGVTLVSRDEDRLWTASFPATRDQEDPVYELQGRLGHQLDIDEVIDASTWTGSLSVADRYRGGRVFLVGDSAHHFFPTGGHGANTGIGDAVDIAWKLAAVREGWGHDDLLSSYEAERRPVALFKREMSANLLEVWRRFGRLVRQGTSRDVLRSFLVHEEYQHDNLGLHFGDDYANSPVVATDLSTRVPTSWSWAGIPATASPGRRLPATLDPKAGPVLDRLGDRYTLVDATADRSGTALVGSARSLGFHLAHVAIRSDGGPLETSLALVRPDHHVAWVGAPDSADWPAVLRRTHGFD